MARVIPIKGLDADLDKVVNDLKSAIERRNHLNSYIEALTEIQDIYMKIKILAGTLGFSVKEIEFSEKTISNLDILFKNSNMSSEDIKQYEADKNNYLEKMNSAQVQVISKSQELDNQINLLLELKENVKDELADKDFSTIDNILKSLDQFVLALDLKKIVEKALKDQKNPKKPIKIEKKEEEEKVEVDDFSYLDDLVYEGKTLNGDQNKEDESVKEEKEETPVIEVENNEKEVTPEVVEEVIPNGKKVISVSNINPTINSILHPELKPVVEDKVDIFSTDGPVIPNMGINNDVVDSGESIFETIPSVNN